MKVKDFLNWLKENDVNEDSEIEITRFFDNDIVANGNFLENDLNYDKDLRGGDYYGEDEEIYCLIYNDKKEVIL